MSKISHHRDHGEKISRRDAKNAEDRKRKTEIIGQKAEGGTGVKNKEHVSRRGTENTEY